MALTVGMQQHDLLQRPKYRYTIPELLSLKTADDSFFFDLSRFTYQAARAGVVPSLNDCAVSSRKSSYNPAKNWGVEPSSADDLFTRAINCVPSPDPHSSLPPPEGEKQKDPGFAKFLKKHTSPSHNRVTAGGRIVPMEKPSAPIAPPAFSLPSKENMNQCGINRQEYTKEDAINGWSAGVQPSIGPPYIFNNNNHFQPGCTRNELVQSANFVQSYNEILPWDNSLLTSSYSWSPIAEPAAFSPNDLASTSLYVPFPSPLEAHQSPSALPWSSIHNTFVSSEVGNGLEAALTRHAGANVLSKEQLLLAWKQHYLDLEQQLKIIDRHRAMNSLDPYLAYQRRLIAQQRSDAKDVINEYKRMMGVHKQCQSSEDSLMTDFNIGGPVFRPAKWPRDTAWAVSTPAPIFSQQAATNAPKSSGKRPIPIVAPPAESLRPAKHIETEVWMPEASTPSADTGFLGNNITGRADSELTGNRIFRERASDEYDQKQALLDALAMPQGSKTRVEMGGGAFIEIEGQGARLKIADEDNPWLQLSSEEGKDVAKQTRQQPRELSNKENIPVPDRTRQKAVTDAFVSQFRSINDSIALASEPETQSLRNLNEQRNIHHSVYYPQATKEKLSSSTILQDEMKHEDAKENICLESPRSPDYLNNKSYSSSGIQNVYASPLSHLDGQMDVRRASRAARDVLAQADKQSSPRLLRRLGFGGKSMWYGPFAREVVEKAVVQSQGVSPDKLKW